MARQTFPLILIKPSHYDDDGYVIRFWRSAMPSNTLAALFALARNAERQRAIGEDVELRITAIDETNRRVPVAKLIREIKRAGGHGMVGLVGVQSNQYPRALDLARRFRAADIQVVLGGFHPSGVLAMLPEPTPEIEEALELGVSIYAGEAEGRFEEVLRDAYHGTLKPIYNFMDDLPSIEGVPAPILPSKWVRRTGGRQSSFDAGRGCPFQCSFCTIINVQGRKSRYRSPDDIERVIRENVAQGVKRFFVTDDNFARNSRWEEILDRLIELRRREGLKFNLALQVDTLCHRIPGFIDKSRRAGVKRVFIGLENINPDSLVGAKKRQNRITEYRKMLQEWRNAGIITVAGYILGFPGDTPESIVHDLEIIKRELPIDILEFFFLTPLPGSEDHKALWEKGAWLEPDLNCYDLNHACFEHDSMSKAEWQRAYRLAWDTYYSDEHIKTLLRRARASGLSLGKILGTIVWFYESVWLEGVHPLESGFLRFKDRLDRRPGMPVESAWRFYPRYLAGLVHKTWHAAGLYLRYYPFRRRLERDPEAVHYRDLSLEPVTDEELAELEMFQVTEAARAASRKAQQKLVSIGTA